MDGFGERAGRNLAYSTRKMSGVQQNMLRCVLRQGSHRQCAVAAALPQGRTANASLLAHVGIISSQQRLQLAKPACRCSSQSDNQRRQAKHCTCSHPISARCLSSWTSGLKSASEYLFSDTLDRKTEVGVDDAGNRYYEVIRTFRADNSKQLLRIVEPDSGSTAADYDPTSVPPQWRSWLSYSRRDPPTAEELLSRAPGTCMSSPNTTSPDNGSGDGGEAASPSSRTVRL